MILRLSQVFQNIPGDELMLFHSLCLIQSYSLHVSFHCAPPPYVRKYREQEKAQVCQLSPSECHLEGKKNGNSEQEKAILPTETFRLNPVTWEFSQISRCLI